jgi:hypothetical protein
VDDDGSGRVLFAHELGTRMGEWLDTGAWGSRKPAQPHARSVSNRLESDEGRWHFHAAAWLMQFVVIV